MEPVFVLPAHCDMNPPGAANFSNKGPFNGIWYIIDVNPNKLLDAPTLI